MGGEHDAPASPSPPDAFRERARERGRALLAVAPFDEIADRATLLLTSPPTGVDSDTVPAYAGLWLIIETGDARALPAPYRGGLTRDSSYVEFLRASGEMPAVLLTITTNHTELLEGVSRRSLEARWSVRHAEAVRDRLDRLPRLAAAAARFPHEAMERILRPLWLQAAPALRTLWIVAESPGDAVPVAGEAAAAVCRIACVFDSGDHPPTEFLFAEAKTTRIGRRLTSWLDDFAPALGGDEVAARRVTAARDQVQREIAAVLAERYGDRPWLRDPEAFALRTPR
jgi:hypothetical protein